MKKISFILAFTIYCMASSSAQTNAISKYYSEYEEDRTFTVVSISGRMFNMFTDLEVDNPEDQAILDMVSKLSSLKVVTKDEHIDGLSHYRKAIKKLEGSSFQELMSIREEDEEIKFFTIEESGKISEILMLMGSEHEFTILSLTGIIELSQLSKLSKKLDIDGFEHLERIDDKN